MQSTSTQSDLSPAKAIEEIRELAQSHSRGAGAVSTGRLFEILYRVPGHLEERQDSEASERYEAWVADEDFELTALRAEVEQLRRRAQLAEAQLREARLTSYADYDMSLRP